MIRQHIIRTILFALIGIGVGFLILATSPKIYEGRANLVVGTQAQNSSRAYGSTLNEDVATILQAGLAINPETEVQLLRSEGVFNAALEKVIAQNNQVSLRTQAADLYGMYDVAGSAQSSAVMVRARAYSPETASMLATAVADAYNERRQATQRASVSEALTYLEDQITKEKLDLTQSEEKLKQAKLDLGLPEVGANIARDVEYQSQMKASIDAAKAELASLDKSIIETDSAMNAQPKFEPGDLSEQKSNTLQALESQLSDLERQKQTLLVQYFEDAESVKLINGSIASVKKQIAEYKKRGFENVTRYQRPDQLRRSLEAKLTDYKIGKQAVMERIANMQNTYDAVTLRVNQVPESSMKLADLAREVEIKESNYRRLRIQSEDIKNRTEATAKAAQIFYEPVPDKNPVLPRPPLVLVVSVLAGGIFGLLVSFAIEAMRLRIYSSTQLQELTDLPVAGVIHDLPRPTAKKLLTSLRDPNPAISESYRFLAFSSMAHKGEGTKKILLTAIDNNAGCSTSSAQFATAMAQTGAKVLLVDCALEDPTITKVFGLDQKSGVSDILSQTQLPTADSTLGADTAVPNLRVLGAGTEGRNSIKISSSQNINGMIGSLASQCDVLVIDSMACLSSSDAARLVPYVDEVYLIVNAKTANMRNVAAAIDVLTLASAASIKFIVTKGNRGEEAVMKQANLASVRV